MPWNVVANIIWTQNFWLRKFPQHVVAIVNSQWWRLAVAADDLLEMTKYRRQLCCPCRSFSCSGSEKRYWIIKFIFLRYKNYLTYKSNDPWSFSTKKTYQRNIIIYDSTNYLCRRENLNNLEPWFCFKPKPNFFFG